MYKIIIASAYLFLLIFSSSKSQLIHPYNLGFEISVPGAAPEGWTINSNAELKGFAAFTTEENALRGKYCMAIISQENISDEMFFKVFQTINASSYAGKRIKLRASIKFEKLTPGSGAYMWAKANFSSGESGVFLSTQKSQVSENIWKTYEIEGTIDKYARFIDFGFSINGWCKAWVDDVSFEVIDTMNPALMKKPAPITQSASNNIMAFAQLYGIIRYFYPSFENMKSDWEKIAYAGIEYFENLNSQKELIKSLNDFFLPLAPGIELYSGTKKPNKKLITDFPENSLKNAALIYKYEGSRDLLNPDLLPFNIFTPARETEGSVYQLINAAPYIGKRMKLSCMARIESEYPYGRGQIVIQIEKKDQKHSKRQFLPDLTITGNQWKKYSIEMDILQDYDFIVLQLALIGEGKAYFDNVEFTSSDKNDNICKNPSFEMERDNNLTFGWKANPNTAKSLYNYLITDSKPFDGNQCLMIESDSTSRINMPSLGSVFSYEINPGFAMRMPRILFVDSVQTLPHSNGNLAEKAIIDTAPAYFSVNDRTSRLAIVVMAWNVFRHFSLTESNDKAWDGLLRNCLEKAAVDSTEDDFLETLGLLTTIAQDPQSRFWLTGREYKYALPFLLKWIENKLYISTIAVGKAKSLKSGTEILEINGRPAIQYYNEKSRFLSGSEDWKKIRIAALLRAGDAGEQIKLKYKLPDNTLGEGNFVKDISIEDLSEPRPDMVSFFDPTGKLGDSLPGGYYYIDLTRVTEEEIEKGAEELSFADGIVFDLRGIANVSYTILGYLTKDTLETFEWCLPVFTNPGNEFVSYRAEYRRIIPKPIQLKQKVIFLCDEKTIGNSEAILNLVKIYKLGQIAGKNSGGSPGITSAFILPGGISFSLKEIKIRDRKSKQFVAMPIIPDFTINPGPDSLINYEADIVKRAFDLFNR